MDPTTEPEPKDIQQTGEASDLVTHEQQQQQQQQQQPTSSRDMLPELAETGTQSPPKQIKPNKVYIGGLPDDTRDTDLQDCFGAFGPIKSIELKTGYGFVEFESRQAAEKAVSVYNEGIFLGNTIRVELSHGGGKTSAKATAEPGACFKCGQHGHWARECPNHSLIVHKRPWVGSGSYHQRSDSYRENQAGPQQFSRPRDDYRNMGRPKDEYAPRPRDYGARDGEFRRPPSPTYDYGRGAPVPPPAAGYNDRRYPPPPQAPRAAFSMERPPSPSYGPPRPVGAPYDAREYDRSYDRTAPYYDPRAAAPPVLTSYPDRRDLYNAPPAPPPTGYPPAHSYSYPPTRDQPGRRSPPRQGRYQNYGNQNGYNRPYERRRSASPPQYREDVPTPAGNGYARGPPPAPYGRPQPYASGPGYGDAARGHGAPIPPGVNNGAPGAREYRGYRA